MNSIQAIQKSVLDAVMRVPKKSTPLELENTLIETFVLNRKQAKSVIQQLITSGELTYTYHYGSTYLEKSFNRAVRISKQVLVVPPGLNYQRKPHTS